MQTRHKVSLKIVQFALKVVLFLSGVRLRVFGLEKIPRDRAVLYVANHSGFFDTVAAYSVVPNLTGFVSKVEMEHIPFLSTWMRFVNCLFMDRVNLRAALKTILEGVKRIQNGISMFIFPEGTRTLDGTLSPFKEGSLKMASKAQAPIQPVAMFGTAAILEDQFPKIRKGTVTVVFGDPIYTDIMSKAEQKHLGAYTQNVIQKMLDEGPDL